MSGRRKSLKLTGEDIATAAAAQGIFVSFYCTGAYLKAKRVPEAMKREALPEGILAVNFTWSTKGGPTSMKEKEKEMRGGRERKYVPAETALLGNVKCPKGFCSESYCPKSYCPGTYCSESYKDVKKPS